MQGEKTDFVSSLMWKCGLSHMFLTCLSMFLCKLQEGRSESTQKYVTSVNAKVRLVYVCVGVCVVVVVVGEVSAVLIFTQN